MKKRSLKKYVIFPCCVLIFGVLEELATYKSTVLPNDHIRVFVLMAFFAFGISVIAYVFAPMIERFFFRLHAVSKFSAGRRLGDIIFVLLLLSLVYFLWYVILVHGPENLLPPAWR